MDDFHSLYGRYPGVSVCDAGYGSEENCLYASRHGISSLLKGLNTVVSAAGCGSRIWKPQEQQILT